MIKKKKNMMGAVVVGAGVIGAAAGAAAVVLSDPKNRDKANKLIKEARGRGEKLLGHAKEEATKNKAEVKKKALTAKKAADGAHHAVSM